MNVGDYYVLTRQLRADGTMEFNSRTGRATPNLNQAMREARGNAQRLKGDGRPFGVEVHEIVRRGDAGEVGEVGERPQFVTAVVIEDGGTNPPGSSAVASRGAARNPGVTGGGVAVGRSE